MYLRDIGTRPRKLDKEESKLATLKAQGYELLDPGRYVLEVVEAEPVDDFGPQLRLRLRVAEGEHKGFEFVDYPNRGAKGGVKVGTKAWDIFEASLNRRLSPEDELDTDDLVGKTFQAMVSVKKTGKGNRTEHGTIGPYRPKKTELRDAPIVEEPGGDEDEFGNLPFA
jgi:hypothetical protein